MRKKEVLEKFIRQSNLWRYDYGDGVKSLPLVSKEPGDPEGLYTANVPLLSVPLIGDLEHRGDKFKYHGVSVPALVQDTEWDNIPRASRTFIHEAVRKSGFGQGGGKYTEIPYRWAINFGAENARMGINTWGGAGGVASCKVVFFDDASGNDQMIFCDDSGALYSHVRRNGSSGMLEWDTVRWASGKINGVDAPTNTTPLEFGVVYDLEMTANINTGVRWIGEGPSSASDTFLNGNIADLSFTGGTGSHAYDTVVEADEVPITSVVPDTVGSNNASLVGFGSRPLWTLSQI